MSAWIAGRPRWRSRIAFAASGCICSSALSSSSPRRLTARGDSSRSVALITSGTRACRRDWRCDRATSARDWCVPPPNHLLYFFGVGTNILLEARHGENWRAAGGERHNRQCRFAAVSPALAKASCQPYVSASRSPSSSSRRPPRSEIAGTADGLFAKGHRWRLAQAVMQPARLAQRYSSLIAGASEIWHNSRNVASVSSRLWWRPPHS